MDLLNRLQEITQETGHDTEVIASNGSDTSFGSIETIEIEEGQIVIRTSL